MNKTFTVNGIEYCFENNDKNKNFPIKIARVDGYSCNRKDVCRHFLRKYGYPESKLNDNNVITNTLEKEVYKIVNGGTYTNSINSNYQYENKEIKVINKPKLTTRTYHVNDIETVINDFIKGLDDEGRFKSFEYCYFYFQQNYKTNDENIKDIMTLHLFAYLSSWGMLRNSFLLYKSYKFNRPIIDLLCKAMILNDTNPLVLARKITNLYLYKDGIASNGRNTYLYKGETRGIFNISDTLITKILMGTIGNVPAYDRYFRETATAFKMSTTLCNQSLIELQQFIKDNNEAITKCANKLNYPKMKIVDMYFWQKSYINSKDEE